PEWKSQLGYDDHEIVGGFHEWESRVHPDDLPGALASIHQAVSDGRRSHRFEFRLRHKDGTYRWILAHFSTQLDDAGKPMRALGSHIDITERKQREYERTMLLGHMVEDAPALITVCDLTGRFIFANQTMLRLHGYSERDLGTMSICDLERPGADVPLSARLHEVVELGETSFEVVHRRKDGRSLPLHVVAKAVPWRGEPCVLCIATDMTEQKRADAILESRLRLLERAAACSLAELLQASLDEAEALSGSEIGFYHFVEPDQETVSLQAWSTNTERHMCKTEGARVHYPIHRAGVWVDCVHAKRPVIHNDYASLPHKKGLPAGHAPIVRELVVPVLRNGKVVAVLGVGNKPTPYDEDDVEALSLLADLAWEISERKMAEESLRRSQLLLSGVERLSLAGGWEWDVGRKHMYWTEGTYRLHDFEASDFLPGSPEHIARSVACYDPEDRPGLLRAFEKCRAEGQPYDLECGFTTFAGRKLRVRTQGRAVWESGRIVKVMGNIKDVTDEARMKEEQQRLSDELAHAQKMEAVGRLAGGVAHDFNNVLNVILGNLELVLEDLPDHGERQDELREELHDAQSAAWRAADLTRQLLAFARKQTITPTLHDLNDSAQSVLRMLRRLIGEDVELLWKPSRPLPPVRMDPAQIDQILANLIVNARDAIGRGVGRITVETHASDIEEEHDECPPGRYIELSVRDDGCGMDKDTMDRIFEPFFTTKGVGKGTGLGLATVYGIVKQNRGRIVAESEPGKGTTFRIYVPVYQQGAQSLSVPPPAATGELVGGNESILLVEDEPALLSTSAKVLRRLGYRVLAASSPEEALRIADRAEFNIDLLVTDVVMPQMNGRQLADRIVATHPGVRCLYMSGHPADIVAPQGVLEEGVHFIEKPFSRVEMAAKVREVLGDDDQPSR
ncbi:MAG: PAS domain-containing protein, partial [Myxococcota bacterium]